jgi:hypothetical protein
MIFTSVKYIIAHTRQTPPSCAQTNRHFCAPVFGGAPLIASDRPESGPRQIRIALRSNFCPTIQRRKPRGKNSARRSQLEEAPAIKPRKQGPSQGRGFSPGNACMHLIPKWKDNFHFGIKSLTLNPACRQLSQKNRRPNEIKCISVTKPRLSVSENPHFPRRISQRHALGESASGRVGTASTGAVSCTLCPVPCPYIRCCNASQT